jgi:hypothetical protein
METLSKSAFSRRLHVSPARVTQLIAKGMPVTPDGKVDVAEALTWIESHIDLSHKDAVARRQAEQPAHQPPPSPAGFPPPAETPLPPAGVIPPDPGRVLLTAKARRAIVELRRAERLERVETGELVEVAEVQGKIDAMIHNAKSKLMGLGHVLAPRVAIETDVAKCQDLIDEGVREALAGLAGYQPA